MKIPKDKLTKIVPDRNIPIKVISNQELSGSYGLGSVLETFFKPIVKHIPALQDCQGCKQRKELLNRIFPFEDNTGNPS